MITSTNIYAGKDGIALLHFKKRVTKQNWPVTGLIPEKVNAGEIGREKVKYRTQWELLMVKLRGMGSFHLLTI